MTGYSSFPGLARSLGIGIRPRVFVSYHHDRDQHYADQFESLFHKTYRSVTDRSLKAEIESRDADYVYRRIREDFITGTSCTVVLCGFETPQRRYIDWEIKATLDKQHALLGVILPTHRVNINGKLQVPDRLYANVESGYAHWIYWTTQPYEMLSAINMARSNSMRTHLIQNAAPMMKRSR